MALSKNDDLGKKHGKYDMDRIGLFSEMPYMIHDKYKESNKHNNVRDLKKSQMYPSVLKTKTGLQDAYFDKTFKRLFENEKWQESSKLLNMKSRNKDKNLIISTRPFIPSGSTKYHSTPGDYYGTFGPKLPAMSPTKKTLPKKDKLLANVMTIPTNTRGPGYADLGLSPFPEYKSSPYDDPKKLKNGKNNNNKSAPFLIGGKVELFENNPYFCSVIKPTYKINPKQKFNGPPFIPPSKIKNIGNGFDKWPSHLSDRYIDPYKIGRNNSSKNNETATNKFYPQTRNKSLYTVSTMERKLKSALNNNNWQTFEPITFPMDKLMDI